MTTVIDMIRNDYKALQSSDRADVVQDFFNETHLSHFPVLEQEEFMGNLSQNDAETFTFDKNINQYKYTFENFFARAEIGLLDLLEIFARHQTDIVPILDVNNRYIGYYEVQDIIRVFNETPFLSEKGTTLIVEKDILDYSMSQVVQIVESNNGKVLGSFISSDTNSTVQISIKISSGSINEIIQTFRRYNYQIISEHYEDYYLADLKDRSDYLKRYLNI